MSRGTTVADAAAFERWRRALSKAHYRVLLAPWPDERGDDECRRPTAPPPAGDDDDGERVAIGAGLMLAAAPFRESVVLLPNPPRLTGEAMARALAGETLMKGEGR